MISMLKKWLALSVMMVLIFSPLVPRLSSNSVLESGRASSNSDAKKIYPIMTFGNYQDSFFSEIKRAGLSGSSSGGGKILFDVGHDQYYDASKLASFLDLVSILGDVVVNMDAITADDLEDVKLLIIPNPESAFSAEEIAAIQSFLENNGSLLIMGNWYGYFTPSLLNDITSKYGILWEDTSVRDDTNNHEGVNYNIIAHVWVNNSITREIGIIDYIDQVYFTGTILTLKTPEDISVVEEGPYPIGTGDEDTWVQFENGTEKTVGENGVLFVAVKLVGGGKIFASGTTGAFAYDRVYLYDNLLFTLLVVGWLLDMTPEDALVPLIESFLVDGAEEVELIPQKRAEVELKIKNLANAEKPSASIGVDIPYFLEVVDNKVTITRANGTYERNFVYGEHISLGTLQPGEEITISFYIECSLGMRKEGSIIAGVYLGESKIMEKTLTVKTRPAFTASAYYEPFPLNLTVSNTTILHVTITSDAPYIITGVNIELRDVPEEISVNVTRYTIESLSPGETKRVAFEISTTEIGAYSLPVVITTENGGEDVVRASLIATTTRIIIFDEGHYQYWAFTSKGMPDFIELLRGYGPVLISKGEISSTLLDPSVTALYIIPNPQPSTASPTDTTTPIMTDDEISAIQDYVESGGSLLIMANWYRYFWPDNPNGFNDLTSPYGIYWVDGDVYDPVNYQDATYHVIGKSFADNDIARMLTAGVTEVHFAGTAIEIKTATVPTEHYPILIGNNESYLTDDQGNRIKEGSDIIMILAAIVNGKGKILASGSVYMFSSNYYYSYDSLFIQNMITWLLGIKEIDIEVSGVPYETEVGKDIIMNVKVINRGVEVIIGINLTLIIPSQITNKNGTVTVRIASLAPGECNEFAWILSTKAEGTFTIQLQLTAENYPKTVEKALIIRVVSPGMTISPEMIILASISVVIVGLAGAIFILYKKAKKSAPE